MSMLFLPSKPVSIIWQSTVVDIGPTARYGQKSDVASINTDICLNNPEASDLALPLTFLTSDEKENQPPDPTVRIKKEVRNLSAVEIDEAAAKSLEDTAAQLAQANGQNPDEARAYIRGAIERAKRYHKTFVTLKPGQKLVIRTSQRHRIKPDAAGVIEFSTVAPMPQYLLQTGGSVHVAVLLPRPVDGLNPQLVDSTQGFNRQEASINGRFTISWLWQNDPVLMVKYKY
ncbi:MAG: hypothetical protein M1548_04010 [Actinobacteria bacterium]|nr:hypothetical protein [Actinomycetota bacterium]